MARCYPVLKQHVTDMETRVNRTSYLGKDIQNKLIDCTGGKLLEAIVKEIKQNKYFLIFLDCISDMSDKEQWSVIIRLVSVEDTPQIKGHFMGFLYYQNNRITGP